MSLFSNLFGYRQDDQKLKALTYSLYWSTDKLRRAMQAKPQRLIIQEDSMNPILQALADQVTATNGVMASATTLITGFSARLEAAVAAALAGGATAAQLAPISDEVAAMKASSDALAAAVAAIP